ncbi:esterase-like activity of phytase family protein [Sphingomonas sp. SUN039]|uniref:esterase-like activity of phytase family protein n=1 Tax=Sphingomonas sp. SUN039 TaxID=2937787 RepID=UPI0021643643|nr:esterase-like activity of phytase family protein [Sphingomonas sp. SUN039]UVO55363.1 esterase-like activity of phytase family protein [Sphingomonas sp. SUN039]
MRRFRTSIVFLPLLVIGGARSSSLSPVVHEDVTIVSTPVTLQPDDPARTRAGQLTLLAGWKLTSRSHQFGSWSALSIDGDRITAIGDYGSVLRFRLTSFGRAVEARIDPLPGGCGRQDDKRQRDSESLSRDRSGWWIGYEVDNRLCKVTPDFTRTLSLVRPPAMAKWNRVNGAEAMVRLNDGRLLVFAEDAPKGMALRPLLVFSGDPDSPATPVVARSYIPPAGYSPTDAAQLPDGRVLVLNRRFGIAERFTSVLTVFDPAVLDSAAPVASTPVAVLAPPTLHDNFEGLAVTVEDGRPIVWMISDDNFMSWQGTYLLKFALDPPRAVTP